MEEEGFNLKGGRRLLLDGSMGKYLYERCDINKDSKTWVLSAILEEE